MDVKYRRLNPRFWTDSYVRGLTAEHKFLFLYLILNHVIDTIGVYEISVSQMAFDTGLDEADVLSGLERLEGDGRIIYKDGWIVLHNFEKYQMRDGKINIRVENLLEQCPEWAREAYRTGPQETARPITPKKPVSAPPEVKEVFEHWAAVMKKRNPILDKDRVKRIQDRLESGFTVEQLKQAIDGATKDDWIMGRAKNSDKKYDGIETVLRDNAQVEKFLAMGAPPAPVIKVTKKESNLPPIRKGGSLEDALGVQ